MDTSEIYIKMCDKAEEIQSTWIATAMDIMTGRNLHGIFAFYSVVLSTEYKKLYIWLPRQDQLQEMINEPSQFAALSRMIETTCGIAGLGNIMIRPQFAFCKSLEQLWLAFLMKEKFDKSWNGEDWVEE